MRRLFRTVLAALLLTVSGFIPRMRAEDLLSRIDSLRLSYDFPAAVDLCLDALDQESDSSALVALNEMLVLCRNGENMMDYAVRPSVVARQKFSSEEFLLFYPMDAPSWKACPNELDTLGGDVFSRGIYCPPGATQVLFSAPDTLSDRNIYSTVWQDSTWSDPVLAGEFLCSPQDEIYPMLSGDGNTLYFASRGHYGMGGFDIYVSTRSGADGSWSYPLNLGLPYSSPYDDFLYYNTPDGRYTIFASNRGCSGTDSLYLYVLEYEPLPVHSALTDVAELTALAGLSPKNDPAKIDNSSALDNSLLDNSEVRMYAEKIAEVRRLRDEISRLDSSLADLRRQYEDFPSAQLKEQIIAKEMDIPEQQSLLDKASRDLQSIEMKFLLSGVVIDMDKVKEDAEKEVVGASSGFTFTRIDYICE